MKENRQAVTHEAGEFIRRNLRDFPSPLSGELFKNLSKPKEVHYIASSTEMHKPVTCLNGYETI